LNAPYRGFDGALLGRREGWRTGEHNYFGHCLNASIGFRPAHIRDLEGASNQAVRRRVSAK